MGAARRRALTNPNNKNATNSRLPGWDDAIHCLQAVVFERRPHDFREDYE
jgi:hypothetical protein